MSLIYSENLYANVLMQVYGFPNFNKFSIDYLTLFPISMLNQTAREVLCSNIPVQCHLLR